MKSADAEKSKLVGRPSLMLPPSFVEGGVGKFEYEFYSPPLKQDMVKEKDLVHFNSSGDQDEVDLMKNKHSNWVGSSHGWLGLFNKNNRSMSLINPVSGRSIHLPPLVGEPFLDEEKTLKVILSHSPTNEKCRALVIHGSFKRAAVCSPGRSEKWSPLAGRWNKPSRSRYNDFVYSASRKAFVSSTRVSGWLGLGRTTEELEFWDAESTMEAPVRTVRAPPVQTGGVWRTYLASEEESGQLFMVRRYHDLRYHVKMVHYNVYSIERYVGAGDVLQLRSSLDDLVMFIGMNHSFAVKASRFPEYKPNCIYFSGGWRWRYGKQNKPLADVYDYESKSCSQLFYGNDFPFDHNLPWLTLTQDKD